MTSVGEQGPGLPANEYGQLRYLRTGLTDFPDRDTCCDEIAILVMDYQRILATGDCGTFTVMNLNTVRLSETSIDYDEFERLSQAAQILRLSWSI